MYENSIDIEVISKLVIILYIYTVYICAWLFAAAYYINYIFSNSRDN